MGIYVIPGWKICPTCKIECYRKTEITNEEIDEPDYAFSSDDEVNNWNTTENRDVMNSTLNQLELTPFKVHAIPGHMKVAHGKRKLAQVNNEVSKRLAAILNVQQSELESADNSTEIDSKQDMNQRKNYLDKLVELMKEKLKVSNKREKIQILTLTPESWSLRKTAKEFKVSKATARKARIIREEKGILAVPQPVIGERMSEKTVNSVLEFYQNDEYSRQLPGKKDCVSIGKNVHVSKRLILCNLKELYTAFKDKHPDLKISFSKFASLRPKWCITVGPKGTHSVCVCTAHQNVKLLLSSVNLSKDYHELLELTVCNRNSKECIIHRCES